MNKQVLLQRGIGLVTLVVIAASGIAAASPAAPAAPGSTLDQRVAQRKAEQGTNLNQSDSQRIISSCVNAQSQLRALQTNEVSNLDNHSHVYGSIDAKLWITVGELKLSGKDTFQLEKQRLALADKTANFQLLANNYKQAIDDSLLINCKADPNGFKAMLETVRAYYDQLRTQSGDSRDFIINTVKNSLGGFVSDLQPKTPSGGN